jgi:flagellar motor component MotA
LAVDELEELNLAEMEEWKRRNQEERLQLLDQYAEWLRRKGILSTPKAPKRAARGRGR